MYKTAIALGKGKGVASPTNARGKWRDEPGEREDSALLTRSPQDNWLAEGTYRGEYTKPKKNRKEGGKEWVTQERGDPEQESRGEAFKQMNTQGKHPAEDVEQRETKLLKKLGRSTKN